MEQESQNQIEILETDPPPIHRNLIQLHKIANIIAGFEKDIPEWKHKKSAIKWFFSKVVWLCIILWFTFYTTKSSFALLVSYAEGPTFTNVKFMFNTTMHLPMSTICLPLIPEELLNKTVVEIYNAEESNDEHFKEDLFSYFNDSKNNNKNNLLDFNRTWPNSLLYVAQHYLALISQFESSNSSLFGNTTGKTAEYQNDTEKDMISAVQFLETRIVAMNVTIYDFREKFGYDVSVLYKFIATHSTNGGSTMNPIEHSKITFVSLKQICYLLRLDLCPFTNNTDLITISSRQKSLPNGRKNRDDLQAFLDLSAGDQIDASQIDFYTVFNLYLSAYGAMPVKYVAVYQAMPSVNGIVRCSNETTAQCKARCHYKRIEQICNCTPTSSTSLDSTINFTEECHLSQYYICIRKKMVFYDDWLVQCENGCHGTCEHWSYDTSNLDLIYDPEKMTFILMIASFNYPIFEETSTWTFETFVSSFGGVFGLWLGLDILTFIAYLTGLLKKFSTICYKAPNKVIDKHCRGSDSISKEIDGTEQSFTAKMTRVIGYCSIAFLSFMPKKMKNYFRVLKKTSSTYLIVAKIIKFIVLFLIFFQTAIFAFQICSDYLRRPIVSQLNNVNTFNTVPNSTLCLPLYLGELDNSISDEFSKLSDTSNANNIAKYFNQFNTTKEIFLDQRQSWTNFMCNIVHAYLGCLSQCETMTKRTVCQCNISCMLQDADLIAAVNILEVQLKALNVSVDELRQKFGTEVAALYSLSITQHGFLTNVIPVTQTKFVSHTQICYQMEFDLFPLNTSNYINIYTDEYSLPNVNPNKTGASRDLKIVDFLDRLHVVEIFTSIEESAAVADSIATAMFGEETWSYIEVLAVYRALPKISEEVRCSVDQTMDECQAICRIKSLTKPLAQEIFQEICNCTPTSWQNINSYQNWQDKINCTLEQYTICLHNDQLLDDPACITKCLPHCEQWSFSIVQYINPECYFNTLIIQINNLHYPIFEESYKWTFQSFLGEIGGIVGFLLGYTLLDVVRVISAFIIHTVSLLWRKISKYRNGNQIAIQSSLNPTAIAKNFELTIVLERTLGMQKMERKNPFQWIALKTLTFIFVVFFGYMTLENGVGLIQQYQQQKSVFNVEYFSNDSLTFPISTFCFDLWPADFENPFEIDESLSYQAEIDSYFSQSKVTKQSFLNERSLNITFLFIVFKYFSAMNSLEISQNIILSNFTIPQAFTDDENPGSKDLYFALMKMENQLVNLGVTTYELRQLFGRYVSDIFSLKATQITEMDTELDIILNQTEIALNPVTIVSNKRICYQIRLDRYPFQENLQQRIVITGEQPRDSLVYMYTRLYYLDFSGENLTGVDPNPFDYMQENFNTIAQYNFGINSVYRSLPSAHCSEHTTYENCLADCYVQLIRKLCNCTPTSWAQNYDTSSMERYRECRISDYVFCLNYTINDLASCLDDCVGLCERVSIRHCESDAESTNGNMQIKIRVSVFDYVYFEEVPEWTFDSLTGAIGGVFGIYLGLSFFQIVKFLVTAVLRLTGEMVYCIWKK